MAREGRTVDFTRELTIRLCVTPKIPFPITFSRSGVYLTISWDKTCLNMTS